ncbi:hypothetical protein AB3Z07_22745 [Metabacillus halosaccharovorans]|uniref:hypothetical protein n=1 Tax=Metabacillus halosaccharovorans TaxID=930124 RepID=UPI00203BE145|nr:hypothetical protein [Metabacillus halosaccharovorans]MCM3439808.1 hypothetical protein [Metabacillus halosaccharovorans]
MRQDLNKDHHLRKRLDEYHVNIPDFPMKPNRWERFIHFLASPTKDPLDPLISTPNGLLVLKLVPIIGTTAIALIQVLLIL